MNSICIELTLVSPPESRFTPDNSKQFGVAIAALQWEQKDQDFVQIIKVTAWRDVEKFLNLQEGDRVIFEGSINLRTIDKGSYKAKVAELVASNFQVIGASSGDQASTPKPPLIDWDRINNPANPKPSVSNTPVAAIAPPIVGNGNYSPDYDDIPF